ncbi:MAG: hypothetical protein Q8S02_08700 [Hydrogenophaga sp.]|nr:hypothetical protein [Hydrogenophaga sp.]
MKKTPAAAKATTSAVHSLDFKPGNLPTRQNTVLAEVLARLLDGAHLTGMDAVFDAHTTRLSHHIHALRKDHGWDAIEARDLVVGTKDGRVETISVYSLPLEVIAKAMSEGAMSWAAEVRAARRALRAKAALAKRRAGDMNAARLARRQHPGQVDLFAMGGAA